MNDLETTFDRLLSDHSAPAEVRRMESGGDTGALWGEIEALGLLDALVSEDAGGAGLGLRDVRGLVSLAGAHACPLPFADTLVARALLAAGGVAAPDGPIVLLAPARAGEGWTCRASPWGGVAGHALVELGETWRLTDLSEAQRTPSGRDAVCADLHWPADPAGQDVSRTTETRLRAIAAALRAAEMAGAMDRTMRMTLDYATTREQFGRTISRFQAIQQQLAVMAERVLNANTAVRLAFAEAGPVPRPLMAALAKQRAGKAAAEVAAIAHAVHGAIGMSEEYDLQLYTRRLHALRLEQGSEDHWSEVIGRAVAGAPRLVDVLRERFEPAALDGEEA